MVKNRKIHRLNEDPLIVCPYDIHVPMIRVCDLLGMIFQDYTLGSFANWSGLIFRKYGSPTTFHFRRDIHVNHSYGILADLVGVDNVIEHFKGYHEHLPRIEAFEKSETFARLKTLMHPSQCHWLEQTNPVVSEDSCVSEDFNDASSRIFSYQPLTESHDQAPNPISHPPPEDPQPPPENHLPGPNAIQSHKPRPTQSHENEADPLMEGFEVVTEFMRGMKRKQQDLLTREQDLASQEQVLKERERLLNEFEESLAIRETSILEHEEELTKRKSVIRECDRLLTEHEREFDERHSKLTKREKEFDKQQLKLTEQKDILSAHEKDLTEREKILQEREHANDEREQKFENVSRMLDTPIHQFQEVVSAIKSTLSLVSNKRPRV